MIFPGYRVVKTENGVTISNAVFDETELDPSTKWKQAWQNSESSLSKGYVELDDALACVKEMMQ